jgi:hypothetical protein
LPFNHIANIRSPYLATTYLQKTTYNSTRQILGIPLLTPTSLLLGPPGTNLHRNFTTHPKPTTPRASQNSQPHTCSPPCNIPIQIKLITPHEYLATNTQPPIGKSISTTYMCHKYSNTSDKTMHNNHKMLSAVLTTRGTGALMTIPRSPRMQCRRPTSPTPFGIRKTEGHPPCEKRHDPPGGLQHKGNTHSLASPHSNITIYTANTTIIQMGPMWNPHTPTQEHSCLHPEPTKKAYRQNINSPPYKSNAHRQIGTKNFCKHTQINDRLIPPTHPSRNRHAPHTLTNPNYQPYQKLQLNGNKTVTYKHVPAEIPRASTDIRIDRWKINPPNTNGLSIPTTTRRKQPTNDPAHYQ